MISDVSGITYSVLYYILLHWVNYFKYILFKTFLSHRVWCIDTQIILIKTHSIKTFYWTKLFLFCKSHVILTHCSIVMVYTKEYYTLIHMLFTKKVDYSLIKCIFYTVNQIWYLILLQFWQCYWMFVLYFVYTRYKINYSIIQTKKRRLIICLTFCYPFAEHIL